ncbi:carbohydrate ABC transporter permease [Acholeplasma hippikon]|uniref:Inner membrane ABC transporter permease protein ycjP n=1 Tax=Acholeplasma hippikon TaxID=264636 RepID=A0A449BK10_9MOLU|nr:carbohydrate ABC transporter permease [Acholeplasma hippikon]VEU82806.1 Inner membrane ABC transporter permease protein ycjP [Acholeplasma hippikon]
MNVNISANLKEQKLVQTNEIKLRGDKVRRKRKFEAFLTAFFRTVFLAGLCFVILYPTIQQILLAFRAAADINDPSVIWIPKNWSVENFRYAAMVLDYWDALVNTIKLSSISMVLQVISTALAGYAFARLKSPLTKVLFIFVILTIVIPPQALSLAQYLYFREVKLIGKETSIYLMSVLGMGIRSGIFIYIFQSFFKGLPKELEESAQIDGAGVPRIFWNVMLPNARGAIITVALFAFVWQWNDVYFAKIFEVSTAQFPILTMRLLNASENIYAALSYAGALHLIGKDIWSNPMFLALVSNVAALLMMLPLLIMYLFVQKQFVESIERTGIVG